MMDAEDIAAFRADVAQYPGVPLADICGLYDPDEPTAKAYLMEVACERLLRLRPLDLCKSIVASEILNVPDSWYRFGSEGSHSYRVCNACGGVGPTDEEIPYGP